MRRWLFVGAAVLLAGLGGCALCGGKSGSRDEDQEQRAGYPSEVSPWAHPSDTGRYVGYQVGGGKARHGDGPGPDEGTWGWDYGGFCVPSRIMLDWWHGERRQGGAGAYKVDGPRPLEAIHGRHEE